MFDTIYNIIVRCPRCGDEGPKSAQIKSGPQALLNYEFGKDKVEIDWDYEYSIIDKDKRIIRGIATCNKCKEEAKLKMKELVKDAKDKKELECPDGTKYLIECKIGDKDALGVILDRMEEIYGNRYIELFEIAIFINKDNMPIAADPIIKLNNER